MSQSQRNSPPSPGGGKSGPKAAPFIQKLYQMIENSDPSVASWNTDGDMIVIKDPETFAQEIIPNFFVHNNYSSFERQLNFYCFRKVHTRPIRNSDCPADTEKHKTYHHLNFRRGRTDLLALIKRANKGGASSHAADDHQAEVERLKDKVNLLQSQLSSMVADFEGRVQKMSKQYWTELKVLMDQIPQSRLPAGSGVDPSVGPSAALSSASSTTRVRQVSATTTSLESREDKISSSSSSSTGQPTYEKKPSSATRAGGKGYDDASIAAAIEPLPMSYAGSSTTIGRAAASSASAMYGRKASPEASQWHQV